MQPFLLLDQLVDALEILADALFFRFDALAAVLAQQQLEQLAQVLVQLALAFDDRGQAFLLEQLDQGVELLIDVALFALGHGLAQQGGAARVGRGGQLGHPQQQPLELAEPRADLLLFGRQVAVGRRLFGAGFGRLGRIGGF